MSFNILFFLSDGIPSRARGQKVHFDECQEDTGDSGYMRCPSRSSKATNTECTKTRFGEIESKEKEKKRIKQHAEKALVFF